MDNVIELHQTVYAAYAPHMQAIDNAIYAAAISASQQVGASGFAAAYCKTQLIAKELAA